MAGCLRFFDDYGSGWLWPEDDVTRAAFGPGPIGNAFDHRLSAETRTLAQHLLERSAASLNHDYPPDGCQWPHGERLAFDAAADALLGRLQSERGTDYVIRDERRRLAR